MNTIFEVKDMKKQATRCVMILIVALSLAMTGCVDDEAANTPKPSATDDDRINDTNVTLTENATDLNVSEVEELISEIEVMPETEPELETVPEDQDIIVEMNETVDLPRLTVTCIMVKNKRETTAANDWFPGSDWRKIKFDVMINATGEVETGLEDWWIMDDIGRKHRTIPHTDMRPMKSKYELSDGDTVRAYLLFDIPGDVIDFTVQYNCSGEIISWTVGNPSTEPFVRPADGFVRYPIEIGTGRSFFTINDTWVYEKFVFQADGDAMFDGSHRRGLGRWELVESSETCNVYNVWHKDEFLIVNINHDRSCSINGTKGSWEEV